MGIQINWLQTGQAFLAFLADLIFYFSAKLNRDTTNLRIEKWTKLTNFFVLVVKWVSYVYLLFVSGLSVWVFVGIPTICTYIQSNVSCLSSVLSSYHYKLQLLLTTSRMNDPKSQCEKCCYLFLKRLGLIYLHHPCRKFDSQFLLKKRIN